MRTRTYPNRRAARRGFTIRDLAVTLACLLIAAGLLLPLAGANRNLSQAQQCAGHLDQMFTGLAAYVNQYNSFPPHSPYPTYWTPEAIADAPNGMGGWDPNIGWILTYGMGMQPPAVQSNGHFDWTVLDEYQVPEVVTCPAVNRDQLFDPDNPEIDPNSPLEIGLYRYAAFYQTSGTCRAATRLVTQPTPSKRGFGGRNPSVPDPRYGYSSVAARPADNAQWGTPGVWVVQHRGAPDELSTYLEAYCYVQAVHPAEVQSPGQTYYLADNLDYRPVPGAMPYAGSNDGWRVTSGNRVVIGTRHYGYANVLYLDGHVTRDGQTHDMRWNMDYDPINQVAHSTEWRAATFGSRIPIANIQTQWPIMPVLMVKGWEWFFDANGFKPGGLLED